MGTDRKEELSLVPPPYGDDTYKMSRATSKYRFAQFTKVVVDAETEEEAKDLAAIMDGEEIAEHDTHEYNIWNIRELI